MATAFEILFAVGLGIVVLSFAGVSLGRLGERPLVWATCLLAAAAAGAAVAFGVNLVERFTETEPLLLATGGLGAAAAAEAGLVALRRGLGRTRRLEEVGEAVRADLAALVEAHGASFASELDRALARERANAVHVLGEQERRFAEERRDLLARQGDRARTELTEAVAAVQERLERRLAGWAADLDRGQRELEAQLTQLAQRQRETLAAQDARLAADAELLESAAEEQRASLARLRDDLERLAAQVLEEGGAELEAHALQRRRALHEVAERLRARERAMGEQIEREEAEAKARLGAGLADAERRHLDQIRRGFERSATRLLEDAERRFDAQLKQSRERAAERFGRELDKSMEQFALRAEKEVADRIAEVARATADRLQARIDDLARAAEVQQQVSADRIRMISERLHRELGTAEERIAAFEAQIGSDMAAKIDELERAVRSAGAERA